MSWHLFDSRFQNEIVVFVSFIAVFLICKILNITCLFYAITGIRCPTCFMSRAFGALLKGNFAAYVSYNFMALPVAVMFVLELFQKAFGKHARKLHVCTAMVLMINFVYYLWRIL